jgi:hypothetical protein
MPLLTMRIRFTAVYRRCQISPIVTVTNGTLRCLFETVPTTLVVTITRVMERQQPNFVRDQVQTVLPLGIQR